MVSNPVSVNTVVTPPNKSADLNRRSPSIHARIWPARFVERDATEEDKDYQGYYLIGLDRQEDCAEQLASKEDVKMAMGALQTSLQRFEDMVRGDEKYFDGKCSWMSASVVKQADLGELRLDDRAWGEFTAGDDESEDEEELEEADLSEGEAHGETGAWSSRRKHGKGGPKAQSSVAERPAYTGKFRSSADVINRLRWDAGLDSGDYVVGYEDRFLGIMERPLDQWKGEQTDEEFIPQHRIEYFKRKSDGLLVWDRQSRRDEIFGSGVGGGGQAGADVAETSPGG